IWKSAYPAVNHINNIVEHAEDDIDTYKHSGLYLGEALALRALVHFELLKLFGPPYWASEAEKKQVLPYVTKYSFDIKDFDSYDAVYESILSDLGRAEEYLAEDATLVPADRDKTANSFTDARIAHMNLYAVQALIAKVYWSKDDLDNAEKYAEKVISSGKFSFRPASAFVQPDNGTLDLRETIFGLYVSDESTMMKKLALSETVGSSAMRLATDYSVLYEKNSGASTDYRLSAWFDPSIPACRKMVNNIFITGSNTYNGKSILGYDVIRLPELYYIVAEANITKDPAKAKEYFDKVLKSRGRETLEESGEQLTEDLLFEEREREFYGEGFTWFDMKKERKDIMTVSGKTLPGNVAATYTLTVPDEEWESRKNIEI
ncbi:MAG: RagB/SusD family nutrient uptake outer membrane protein, partial [Anaerovoracaceae bacterium]